MSKIRIFALAPVLCLPLVLSACAYEQGYYETTPVYSGYPAAVYYDYPTYDVHYGSVYYGRTTTRDYHPRKHESYKHDKSNRDNHHRNDRDDHHRGKKKHD